MCVFLPVTAQEEVLLFKGWRVTNSLWELAADTSMWTVDMWLRARVCVTACKSVCVDRVFKATEHEFILTAYHFHTHTTQLREIRTLSSLHHDRPSSLCVPPSQALALQARFTQRKWDFTHYFCSKGRQKQNKPDIDTIPQSQWNQISCVLTEVVCAHVSTVSQGCYLAGVEFKTQPDTHKSVCPVVRYWHSK